MTYKAIVLSALALTATLAVAETAPSYAPPAVKPGKRFVITDYGALADGKTVNTKAIQTAIDACAEWAGRKHLFSHNASNQHCALVVPKGTYLSGAIFLKQGVDLLVEKDGVLKGTTNPDDYPQIHTRWEGTEEMWTSAFVNAEGVTGLEISGEGTIDGSGEEWVQKNPFRRPAGAAGRPGVPGAPRAAGGDASATAQTPGLTTISPTAAIATPPATRAAGGTPPGAGRGRPRLIGIQNAKDVRVEGLNLHNQAVWCLFVLYSENVEIDGVRITAEHNIASSDGIDIDSSKHVHINNVYIDDDDDCISIKSGKDADGLRINRPAEDILIENSHFAYGQGGVAMGSETSGGIRNVTVRNCVFDSDNWAPIRFKTQPSRGGVVENITYEDITLHGTRQAFEMNMEWRMVRPLPPSNPLPVVRNVKIINVSGDVKSVGVIHGLADSPIQGVTFTNCKITAATGFRLDHARDVDLSGLEVTGTKGDPITKTDVQ